MLVSDFFLKKKKEIDFICANQKVKRTTIPLKMDEIWYVLGKRAGVIAITDDGFADMIYSVVPTESTD